jgi:L,D-transpeptidase YbiS
MVARERVHLGSQEAGHDFPRQKALGGPFHITLGGTACCGPASRSIPATVAGDVSRRTATRRPSQQGFRLRRRYLVSTSRYGAGQVVDSHRTPLGLHRIAEKIGGGWPIGAVFRGRVLTGFTWQGNPEAPITHRILWLDGLEPGWNRGPGVDTHARYIYIHGYGDETTLGRPMSPGCIHLAGADLLPLFDRVPSGTLVWIES